MKVLPVQTQPAIEPISRRHAPGRARYQEYRACLRWDFGFTCVFCLAHEADLVDHGGAESGLMWIEHFQPQSSHSNDRDSYDNCYYSCRYCNQARKNRPVVSPAGERLLDPCRNAWASHFERRGDELRSRFGDTDAAYTHAAYDLDAPRKQLMRRIREENLRSAVAALAEDASAIDLLLAAARGEEPERARQLIQRAKRLESILRRARRDLERYRAVPIDSDATCRCGTHVHHSLPEYLAGQCGDGGSPHSNAGRATSSARPSRRVLRSGE